MQTSELKEKGGIGLPGDLAFWRRPVLKQRWRRLCWWMARALEKLAEGG